MHLNGQGDRSFSFYRGADAMLTAEQFNRPLISEAKIFHFGAVSLTTEPYRSAIHSAVEFACKEHKIISYDPNYRPFLWASADEARNEMLRPLRYVHILKVSDTEMELLTGEKDLEQGVRRLSEQGPVIVLISLGSKGAFYYCNSGYGILPAYDVHTVDTTGAGDAFLGAVHYCLRGKNVEQLHNISNEEMSGIIDFANAAGSLTTTKKGAIPAMPSLEEIENCRKSIKLLKS